MKVDGYEDCKLLKLNTGIFWGCMYGDICYDMSISKHTHLYKANYSPIFDELYKDTCNYKDIINQHFPNQAYSFHEGDTLYFHKGCKIPRIRGEGHWKRTIKVDKADAVVLPKFKDLKYCKDITLFKNNNSIIYVEGTEPERDFDIGISLYDLFQMHKDVLHENFFKEYENNIHTYGDAVCIYKGNVLACNETDSYVLKLLDGTYDKYIFEDDLIRSISDETRQFSMESIDSIITMLNSRDSESVHAGMRVLANMDYVHYPSITCYILEKTYDNWDRYTPFNSAVNFMLNTIDFAYWRHTFTDVTPHEFHLAKELCARNIKEDLDDTVKRFNNNTNMNVDVNFDIHVTMTTPDGKVLGIQQEEAPKEIDEEEESDDTELDSPDEPSMQLELAFLPKHLHMCNLFCNFKNQYQFKIWEI